MNKDQKNIDPEILTEIKDAIERTRFGEVVIKVHDSKVVQIERTEKKRFD